MQKGFAIFPVIISVIVLSLSAYGIYEFLIKTGPSATIQDKMVPPTPPTEAEIKPTSLYKNTDLGFEFPVPEGFSVKEETEADFHKRNNGDMRKNFTSTLFYPPPEFISSLYVLDINQDFDKSPLSIWVFQNPDNLDPAAFYKKYWYYPFIWGDFTSAKNKIAPSETIMIGDQPATASAIIETGPSPRFILLSQNQKIYLFRATGENNILKGFRFLN